MLIRYSAIAVAAGLALVCLASLPITATSAANAQGPYSAEANDAAIAEACSYYGRRADATRHVAWGQFVAFLADVCAAAEASMEHGTQAQHDQASRLLMRIAELRRTINEMNAERDAHAIAAARAEGSNGIVILSRVTPSGEFLIAHRMGLMAAFDAWLDSGAEFSLASYPEEAARDQ